MSRRLFSLSTILFVWSLSLPRVGIAQDSLTKAVQLNQEAMTDYQNMKIDKASAKLTEAEGLCLQAGVMGPELALTYLNMGVIEAAGRQNSAAAQDYFTRAVCLDDMIMMDPLVSTPDVEAIFNEAKQNAMPDVCVQYKDPANMPPPPPPSGDFPPPPGDGFPDAPPGGGFDAPPPPPPPPPPPQGGPPPPQTDNVRHNAVMQQEKLTPVPVYIEVQPGTPVEKVMLFYRTYGERIYQQIEMRKESGGYAATIGCDVLQTFDPTAIEYYIDVISPGGDVVGSAGNEGQAFQVNMVDSLVGAPPPTLPNGELPEKCQKECPPWNPDCNENCKKYGDFCSSNGDCCQGMVCKEGMCDEGAGGGNFKPKVKIQLGAGTGGAFVPGEEVKPYNRYAEVTYEDWIAVPDNVQYCSSAGYATDEASRQQCFKELSKGVSVDAGMAWSKIHARISVYGYIKEKIMVGATFRAGLPLDSDKNVAAVSPLGMVNFGYRAVGKGTDRYDLTVVAGIGGGFILHRIAYADCNPVWLDPNHPWPNDADQIVCDASQIEYGEWVGPKEADPNIPGSTRNYYMQKYFRKAGYVVAEVGLDQYFWFTKNVGLNIGIMFDALFAPNFAFQGDFQLGVAARF